MGMSSSLFFSYLFGRPRKKTQTTLYLPVHFPDAYRLKLRAGTVGLPCGWQKSVFAWPAAAFPGIVAGSQIRSGAVENWSGALTWDVGVCWPGKHIPLAEVHLACECLLSLPPFLMGGCHKQILSTCFVSLNFPVCKTMCLLHFCPLGITLILRSTKRAEAVHRCPVSCCSWDLV